MSNNKKARQICTQRRRRACLQFTMQDDRRGGETSGVPEHDQCAVNHMLSQTKI